MTAALKLHDVCVAYDRKDAEPLLAVSNASFSVGDSEFVALVGPSGCGKSTILRVLAGLHRPSSGTFSGQLCGEDGRVSSGMVFQAPVLLPWRTAQSNVAFSLECKGLSRAAARRAAAAELARVGLSEFADAYPRQLSGGMQQRVNLARAYAVDPDLLLLDEPFAALDAQTRESMQGELLTMWSERRKAALFVTHQVDEAIFLADRVIVFSTRPAHVSAVFDVPFERPRDLSIKRDPDFQKLEDAIWGVLGAGTVPPGGAAITDSMKTVG